MYSLCHVRLQPTYFLASVSGSTENTNWQAQAGGGCMGKRIFFLTRGNYDFQERERERERERGRRSAEGGGKGGEAARWTGFSVFSPLEKGVGPEPCQLALARSLLQDAKSPPWLLVHPLTHTGQRSAGKRPRGAIAKTSFSSQMGTARTFLQEGSWRDPGRRAGSALTVASEASL